MWEYHELQKGGVQTGWTERETERNFKVRLMNL